MVGRIETYTVKDLSNKVMTSRARRKHVYCNSDVLMYLAHEVLPPPYMGTSLI